MRISRDVAYGQHAAVSPKVSLDTLEEFYSATKVACDEAKNEVRQDDPAPHEDLLTRRDYPQSLI